MQTLTHDGKMQLGALDDGTELAEEASVRCCTAYLCILNRTPVMRACTFCDPIFHAYVNAKK